MRIPTFGGYLLGIFLHFLDLFSDVIFDVKTVGNKVIPKCEIDAILEPKME